MRIFLVGMAVFASATAIAATKTKLIKTLTFSGQCNKLITADRPRPCENVFVNTAHQNGRIGFYFGVNETVVAFSGIGSRQIKQGENRIAQPIDGVLTLLDGKSAEFNATGTCRFNNPMLGPMTVDCTADTAQGRYEGHFVTDGSPPQQGTI
jgi:hypothetical protein